jgi:rhamnogalacturonyl hydrolase YesR
MEVGAGLRRISKVFTTSTPYVGRIQQQLGVVMTFLTDTALSKPISGRQSGTAAGGAAALLSGLTYGAINISGGNAVTSVRTVTKKSR